MWALIQWMFRVSHLDPNAPGPKEIRWAHGQIYYAVVRSLCAQGWGEYYSGTRLAQNDKYEYTSKNITTRILIFQYSYSYVQCSPQSCL